MFAALFVACDSDARTIKSFASKGPDLPISRAMALSLTNSSSVKPSRYFGTYRGYDGRATMAPGVPDSWRMGDVMDEPSREWLRIARPMYQPLTESAERFFSIEGGQGAGALAALDQLVA